MGITKYKSGSANARKVLGILNFLPVEGEKNRKEDVYSSFVKAHAIEGVDFCLIAIRKGRTKKQIDFCSSLGVTFIEPYDGIALSAIFSYALVVTRAITVFSPHLFYSWIRFVVRNRSSLGAIDRYIRKNGNPDIIAALTSIICAGRIAFLVSQKYGIPFVARENRTHYTRGEVTGHYKNKIDKIVRSARALLPVSETLGENIKKVFGEDSCKTIPLSNAVSETFFSEPEEEGWVKDFSQGRFVFAGWTNWRKIKRLDIALEAFSELYSNDGNVCMIIAGPVPSWSKEKVKELGLEKAVMFTGTLDRQQIRYLAHSCDCCIVPSDHDPGNNSVLEAMAAGKPVIVTKCGGSESRITDPSLGIVVEKGDVRGFAGAMKEVYENRASYDAEHISGVCRSLYSEQKLSENLMAVYSEVLENRSS